MNKINLFRRLSQISLVVLISIAGIRHQVEGGGPAGAATIDSYCPFGGIETMYSYLKTGQFLDKTNVSNFILLASVVAVGIIAGSAFCSWLCPFGAVQEWLAGLGRKVFGRNINVPLKILKPLRYLRYITLAVILYFTVQGSVMVFETYDPFKVLFHFKFETTSAYIILAATIIVSLLIDRFWCKYLCPLGAVMSILGKLNLISLRRNSDKCIDCGRCTRECPMNIEVDKAAKIHGGACTKCLQCINACPAPEALTLTIGGERR